MTELKKEAWINREIDAIKKSLEKIEDVISEKKTSIFTQIMEQKNAELLNGNLPKYVILSPDVFRKLDEEFEWKMMTERGTRDLEIVCGLIIAKRGGVEDFIEVI